MELIYRQSESTVKPAEIEITKHTVFLRKDFVEEERTFADLTKTFWVYQEAKLSHAEFTEYSKMITAKNAMNGEHVPGNIAKIMDSQENGDNNQLIIMEAIADLYDVIASMM